MCLVPVDDKELDGEERVALHRAIAVSTADAKAGNVIAAADVLAELRAMR